MRPRSPRWGRPRIAALLILVLVLLTTGGCAALFERPYYSSEPYQVPVQTTSAADAGDEAMDSISNYASLRRAITSLVAEHRDSAQLQFLNYDGAISQDISTACWEVKSSTALGAFAVDYISYDLSRIVSYYQAQINITYKRSAAQVEARESVSTMTALADRLEQALDAGETYLVLELSSAAVTADTVQDYVKDAFCADPISCPVLPEVEVGFYPESGMSRIAEITLDYGMDAEALTQRRQALDLVLTDMAAQIVAEAGEDPAARLDALRTYLRENCTPDETAGGTAWDALIGGAASSQGLALAVKAGCLALDIPCLPVEGRLGDASHWWNIVTLDDSSYHLDVSVEDVFLAGDEQLLGGYWWDTSEYPPCPAPYEAEGPSEEPVVL